MDAAGLIACVSALGKPFGVERSIKLVPGRVLSDRILLSLSRSDLGPKPLPVLTDLARRLDAPEAVIAALAPALDGADMLHLGHEGDADRAITKLYLEYAGAADAALSGRPAPGRTLVHRAFKWDRRAPPASVETRYYLCPLASRGDLERLIDRLAGSATAARFLRAMVDLAQVARPGMAPMTLAVEEPGNPRLSLDINLYPAGLRLPAVDQPLAPVLRELAIPPDQWQAAREHAGAVTLGHVAAGIGRNGEIFATIYFGARDASEG